MDATAGAAAACGVVVAAAARGATVVAVGTLGLFLQESLRASIWISATWIQGWLSCPSTAPAEWGAPSPVPPAGPHQSSESEPGSSLRLPSVPESDSDEYKVPINWVLLIALIFFFIGYGVRSLRWYGDSRSRASPRPDIRDPFPDLVPAGRSAPREDRPVLAQGQGVLHHNPRRRPVPRGALSAASVLNTSDADR